jgi:homoserine kinase type II
METEEIKKIVKSFGIEFSKINDSKESEIYGSPERVSTRIRFFDVSGSEYILDRFDHAEKEHKQNIISFIDGLYGTAIEPILPKYISLNQDINKNDEYHINCPKILTFDKNCFQLSKFILGKPLLRPDYIYDKNYSNSLSSTLINLRKSIDSIYSYDFLNKKITNKSNGMIIKPKDFDLFYEVDSTTKKFHRISSIRKRLYDNVFFSYEKLPKKICHGDLHPINIIWGGETCQDIIGVIDWEFFGIRPEGYDLANLLGCIGIENPYAIESGLFMELAKKIKSHGILSDNSFMHLIDLIVLNRFFWMNEWLRKKDHEMIELELKYMEYLLDNRDRLTKILF